MCLPLNLHKHVSVLTTKPMENYLKIKAAFDNQDAVNSELPADHIITCIKALHEVFPNLTAEQAEKLHYILTMIACVKLSANAVDIYETTSKWSKSPEFVEEIKPASFMLANFSTLTHRLLTARSI